jgi:hypothetical protein
MLLLHKIIKPVVDGSVSMCMVKKVFLFIFVLVCISSCTGSKTQKVEDSADSVDSVPAIPDSTERVISETPMPKAADELFDDFFFNFAANSKLQYKRILFPLHVNNGKDSVMLQKSQWKMNHFFMRQDYYTLIFDNEKQMDIVKDTTVNHVIVEKISLRKNNVKQYIFNRINGEWMMTRVNNEAMYQSTNASFLKFYQRFVVDTAFQVRSLVGQVKFIGPDPDDDFSRLEGMITPDTWFGFCPELPSGVIYNIIYGQEYKESNKKIFVKRGIANGLEIELTFRKLKGKWKLVKLET